MELPKREILKKTIEKAIENGYDEHYAMYGVEKTGNHYIVERMNPGGDSFEMDYERVIFSHQFAKAFWGSGPVIHTGVAVEATRMKAWRFHLQVMVLSDDPIKYLEQFLD